jgi:hypothetical protein
MLDRNLELFKSSFCIAERKIMEGAVLRGSRGRRLRDILIEVNIEFGERASSGQSETHNATTRNMIA